MRARRTATTKFLVGFVLATLFGALCGVALHSDVVGFAAALGLNLIVRAFLPFPALGWGSRFMAGDDRRRRAEMIDSESPGTTGDTSVDDDA